MSELSFTASQKSLSAALALVAPAVPGRTPKDILKFCKLVSQDGCLSVEANDCEKSARANVTEADIKSPGVALVTFADFRKMVDSTRETVAFEADNSQATVRGERSQFKLGLGDAAIFPSMMDAATKWRVSVDARQLAAGLGATSPFCDQTNTRYAFGGVLFESDGKSVHLVGGSERCIAAQKIVGAGDVTRVVIQREAARLIAGVVGEGQIEFTGSDTLVAVETEAARVVCRQVAGIYPKWQDVIPKDFSLSLNLPVGVALNAIEQAMITADRSPATLPSLGFTIDDGMIYLAARNTDGASSQVEVPIEKTGAKLERAYNGDMLRMVFRTFPPDSIVSLSFMEDNDRMTCVAQCGDLQMVFTGLSKDR